MKKILIFLSFIGINFSILFGQTLAQGRKIVLNPPKNKIIPEVVDEEQLEDEYLETDIIIESEVSNEIEHNQNDTIIKPKFTTIKPKTTTTDLILKDSKKIEQYTPREKRLDIPELKNQVSRDLIKNTLN